MVLVENIRLEKLYEVFVVLTKRVALFRGCSFYVGMFQVWLKSTGQHATKVRGLQLIPRDVQLNEKVLQLSYESVQLNIKDLQQTPKDLQPY